MKQIIMAFAICAFANALSLENLQENIQKSLHNHILQGKFTQEKELKGFSNKIKSYGVFRLECGGKNAFLGYARPYQIPSKNHKKRHFYQR